MCLNTECSKQFPSQPIQSSSLISNEKTSITFPRNIYLKLKVRSRQSSQTNLMTLNPMFNWPNSPLKSNLSMKFWWILLKIQLLFSFITSITITFTWPMLPPIFPHLDVLYKCQSLSSWNDYVCDSTNEWTSQKINSRLDIWLMLNGGENGVRCDYNNIEFCTP